MSSSASPTFTRIDIFGKGFISGLSMTSCVVAKLVNDNILNMDGTIDRTDIEAYARLQKRSLWLYIYYLWQQNHDRVDVFARMSKSVPGGGVKASSSNFVSEVVRHLSVKGHVVVDHSNPAKEDLVEFVNLVIEEYSEVVTIPFLEGIYKRVSKKQLEYNSFIMTENRQLDEKVNEMSSKFRIEDTDIYTIEDGQPVILRSKDPKQTLKLNVKYRDDVGLRPHATQYTNL